MNLQLTPTEIEFILNQLASQPYAQVHQLIHKIQAQANAQLEMNEPAPEMAAVSYEQSN